jgi:L-fuconolactonase
VQARQKVAETRWLLELATCCPLIRGVVGWVPLAQPEVSAALDEFAAEPLLKGVRHVIQEEPAPDFLTGNAFNRGLRAITARGLTYDLLIKASQLPGTIAFVDRHPRQVFILDHIAKPVFDPTSRPTWRKQIAELARRENVYCKFSGVVTEVPDWRGTLPLIRQYFEIVVEAFSPRRLMFGSDWPVCLAAAHYDEWLAVVDRCTEPLSTDERARILGGTATEAYHLN